MKSHPRMKSRRQTKAPPLTLHPRSPTPVSGSSSPTAPAWGASWRSRSERAARGAWWSRRARPISETAPDRYSASPDRPEDIARVIEGLDPATDVIRGIVHLWSLDAAAADATALDTMRRAEALGCHSVLHLVQALSHTGRLSAMPRLVLVTRGAQATDEGRGAVSAAQSPLIGLGRVLINEHPDIDTRMIDLAREPEAGEVAALLDELWTEDLEEEVALRRQSRMVPRGALARPKTADVDTLDLTRAGFRLTASTSGIMDHLAWREIPRSGPGPGEVEIRVEAAGLNFRDVLKSLALYPAEADDYLLLGDECAGRVTAVGPWRARARGRRQGDGHGPRILRGHGHRRRKHRVSQTGRREHRGSGHHAGRVPHRVLRAPPCRPAPRGRDRAGARRRRRRRNGRHPDRAASRRDRLRQRGKPGETGDPQTPGRGSRARFTLAGLRRRRPQDHGRPRRRHRAELALRPGHPEGTLLHRALRPVPGTRQARHSGEQPPRALRLPQEHLVPRRRSRQHGRGAAGAPARDVRRTQGTIRSRGVPPAPLHRLPGLTRGGRVPIRRAGAPHRQGRAVDVRARVAGGEPHRRARSPSAPTRATWSPAASADSAWSSRDGSPSAGAAT